MTEYELNRSPREQEIKYLARAGIVLYKDRQGRIIVRNKINDADLTPEQKEILSEILRFNYTPLEQTAESTRG